MEPFQQSKRRRPYKERRKYDPKGQAQERETKRVGSRKLATPFVTRYLHNITEKQKLPKPADVLSGKRVATKSTAKGQ